MRTDAEQQLTEFFHYLQVQRQVSPHTLKSYQRDLEQLRGYCQTNDIEGWTLLEAKQIRSHITNRHRSGLSGASLQRELSAIRSLFNFLLKSGWVEHNPAKTVRAPKTPRKLPEVLDVDQLASLLNVAPDSVLEYRDLAMWELFYSSGLRVSELVSLDLQDMDLEDKTVLIRKGKGGQSRLLPVGCMAIKTIQHWLEARLIWVSIDQQALFVSQRGNRISIRNVQARLEKWGRQQSLFEQVHPHMLRHSFATHMLESSSDIRAVQELLGHSQISTTQIYTQLDFQHLATVYDRSHPRAKRKKTD